MESTWRCGYWIGLEQIKNCILGANQMGCELSLFACTLQFDSSGRNRGGADEYPGTILKPGK